MSYFYPSCIHKEKKMKGRSKGEAFLGLQLATGYTTNSNNEACYKC